MIGWKALVRLLMVTWCLVQSVSIKKRRPEQILYGEADLESQHKSVKKSGPRSQFGGVYHSDFMQELSNVENRQDSIPLKEQLLNQANHNDVFDQKSSKLSRKRRSIDFPELSGDENLSAEKEPNLSGRRKSDEIGYERDGPIFRQMMDNLGEEMEAIRQREQVLEQLANQQERLHREEQTLEDIENDLKTVRQENEILDDLQPTGIDEQNWRDLEDFHDDLRPFGNLETTLPDLDDSSDLTNEDDLIIESLENPGEIERENQFPGDFYESLNRIRQNENENNLVDLQLLEMDLEAARLADLARQLSAN